MYVFEGVGRPSLMSHFDQGVAVSCKQPVLGAAGIGEHQPVKTFWAGYPQHPLQKMVPIRQIITLTII